MVRGGSGFVAGAALAPLRFELGMMPVPAASAVAGILLNGGFG